MKLANLQLSGQHVQGANLRCLPSHRQRQLLLLLSFALKDGPEKQGTGGWLLALQATLEAKKPAQKKAPAKRPLEKEPESSPKRQAESPVARAAPQVSCGLSMASEARRPARPR